MQKVFDAMLRQLKANYNVKFLSDIKKVQTNQSLVRQFGFYANVYAKNQEGIKDLYKIISIAHTEYLSTTKVSQFPKNY